MSKQHTTECPQGASKRNPAEAVAQHISEDIQSNTNHTTSPAQCQGQNDVAKEEQPMSHPTLGIIPDEARRLAAYGDFPTQKILADVFFVFSFNYRSICFISMNKQPIFC